MVFSQDNSLSEMRIPRTKTHWLSDFASKGIELELGGAWNRVRAVPLSVHGEP